MASKPKTIDQYLAGLGGKQRAALEKRRKPIRAAVPKAQECISYGHPPFGSTKSRWSPWAQPPNTARFT
jgi:uncharacterized protein YdhG (YjbR/CyaY superfamily)